MSKPKVYIETTIVSYLTARPSRDLIVAAHQQITRDWWDTRRQDFEFFISQVVIDEAAAGDADEALRRLQALENLPQLAVTTDAIELGQALLSGVPLPPKAAADALHLAVASLNRMDFLVTWNCTHLANAALRARIERVCRTKALAAPVICTPQELLSLIG